MTATMKLAGLHVHRWEPDSVTHVVLIAHGYGEHAGRYDHVARRLAATGAAVLAPDHRGHGRSDGERALVEDADDLVADLALVADYAHGRHPGRPLALLGHSMGGIVAARFAQLQGDGLAALVLSGPVVGGNPDIEALLALDPLPEVPIDPGMLSRDPAVGAAYAADPLVYHGPFHRVTLEALFGATRTLAAGPTFGRIPTLWIHGSEDPLAPLGPTREAIERLRGEALEEHVYPGARHEVLNETNRDEVIADVLDFLERSLAGKRVVASGRP